MYKMSLQNILVSVLLNLFVAQNYGCINLDLEHTLNAGSSDDHRVQVWSQYVYLPAVRSGFRASTKVPVSRDL